MMTKRFLALACAMALTAAAAAPAAALSGEQSRAADALYTLGLAKGTQGTDRSLELEAPATRAAAAILLVRLAGKEEAAAQNVWRAGFWDVSGAAAGAVNYAARQKWISGVSDVKFQPEQTITANAWCAFLLRMLGYSDKAGDFAVENAARFARQIGLTDLTYTGPLSRGDLFDIARGALNFHYKDSEDTILSRLISQGTVSRAAANALGLTAEELTARQIADRCTAAVFQLDSYETQEAAGKREPDSNASGFFISKDGVAVTNYHSLRNAVSAEVTLVTGEKYPVERVLYYDTGMDIAVFRVSKTSLSGQKASAFAWLEMAGTQDLQMGDAVYSIGNPLGLGLSVSEGIVSDPSRTVERYTVPCIMDTADISKGSSGGALLNAYGQAVGITSGAYTYGNSMYLAVPVNPAMTADLTVQGWTLAELAALEAADENA